MKIEYRPIGVVHSPFDKLEDIPDQPHFAKGVKGTVEVFPEFQNGLQDLAGFSHVILLCHFHLVEGYRLRVTPSRDSNLRGLFATRSPRRPNPIGLSMVRLEGIEDNVLSVLDLDIMNETPVLDLKPYVGELDKLEGVRTGWLESV
jgi:tRNA-Thr(GGU) m(6)t(6)A37 methyltransferase TsaA